MSNTTPSLSEGRKTYSLGIDIGSTTVKIAILDEAHHILFPIIKGILQIYRKP